MQDTLQLQRLGCEEAVQGSKFFVGRSIRRKGVVFKGFKLMTREYGLHAIEKTSSPQRHRESRGELLVRDLQLGASFKVFFPDLDSRCVSVVRRSMHANSG